MSPLALFHHIILTLEKRHAHLNRGYMLSAPAIEYKGRAFAFCRKDHMIIKFRDQTELEGRGIRGTQQYQPFTNCARMDQWREVPYYYREDWSNLAELALDELRKELG